MQKLFTGFNATTTEQWKDQLIKDLKGIDFNQLIWKTNNHFNIKPFYTAEDLTSAPAPVFAHSDWNIGELIMVDDEKTANQQALAALNGGVSCLAFCINGNCHIEVLLKDILIEHIAIQFLLNDNVSAFESGLNALIKARGLNAAELNIAVNYDVLAHLAEHGNWLTNQENDLSEVKKISAFAFHKNKLVVDAALYQNTGVNQVTELALILSHYNEYLNYFNETNSLSNLSQGIQINVAVGSDFFMEISKLRALRKLIELIHHTYSVSIPVSISCTTSHLNQASKDAYTNLLRSTTQAMSAVIGGCDSLYVVPFDELNETDNAYFSFRMARNQQIILKEESYLNRSSDIGAGSYYIETITEELATRAFEQFKNYEAKGGFINCLQQGIFVADIKQQATQLQEKVNTGEYVLIGVNKYMNAADKGKAKSAGKEKNTTTLFEPIKAIQPAQTFEPEQTTVKN